MSPVGLEHKLPDYLQIARDGYMTPRCVEIGFGKK